MSTVKLRALFSSATRTSIPPACLFLPLTFSSHKQWPHSFSPGLCCRHSASLSPRTMWTRGVKACSMPAECHCESRRAMRNHTASMAWSPAIRTRWHCHRPCRPMSLLPWSPLSHWTACTESRLLVSSLVIRGGPRRPSILSTSGRPFANTATDKHTRTRKRTRVVSGDAPNSRMPLSTVS